MRALGIVVLRVIQVFCVAMMFYATWMAFDSFNTTTSPGEVPAAALTFCVALIAGAAFVVWSLNREVAKIRARPPKRSDGRYWLDG